MTSLRIRDPQPGTLPSHPQMPAVQGDRLPRELHESRTARPPPRTTSPRTGRRASRILVQPRRQQIGSRAPGLRIEKLISPASPRARSSSSSSLRRSSASAPWWSSSTPPSKTFRATAGTIGLRGDDHLEERRVGNSGSSVDHREITATSTSCCPSALIAVVSCRPSIEPVSRPASRKVELDLLSPLVAKPAPASPRVQRQRNAPQRNCDSGKEPGYGPE